MVDKQQLAAMGEHMREMKECEHALLQKRVLHLEATIENLKNRLAWRNTGSPNGLRRFMTQKQYDAQTPGVQKWYEPIRYDVPDGWKLVPVEATTDMWVSAKNFTEEEYSLGIHSDVICDLYTSMLAAAPEYKP